MNKETYYKDLINEVPDFPKKGVSFKDISPLLASTHMFRLALMDMLQGHNNDLWAGVDSRGFLFAAGLAGVNGGGVFGLLVAFSSLGLRIWYKIQQKKKAAAAKAPV